MSKGIDVYYVYKHTCPNGKVYIGITCRNPLIRWKNGNGYSENKHFYSAILKYGWDNIKHEILYSGLTKEEACQKEIELIARYKSNQKEFGYNIASGGETPWNAGITLSDEIKRKMSVAAKGKKKTPEHIEHMRESRKGYKATEETRRKQSESLKGKNKGKVSPFRGIPRTDETKEKIRESLQRIIIYQYDKNNNLIAMFKCYSEASKKTGIGMPSIVNCCNGRSKTAGGYIFERVSKTCNSKE